MGTFIYWAGQAVFLKQNPFASLATASFVPPFADMVETTFFQFDFAGFAQIGWFTAITLVITFCIIDMFDTIGTLVGTASRAGMVDEKGNMSGMKEALLSDAIGIGLVSYTIMKVFSGKAKEVSLLTYAISLLFLVKFFLAV